jgi:hypothetical protein
MSYTHKRFHKFRAASVFFTEVYLAEPEESPQQH